MRGVALIDHTGMNDETLRRPEAVIFDHDGRLPDTEPLHCKAYLKVLDRLGLRFT